MEVDAQHNQAKTQQSLAANHAWCTLDTITPEPGMVADKTLQRTAEAAATRTALLTAAAAYHARHASRPALKIGPDLSVWMAGNLVQGFELSPGRFRVRVELDSIVQQQYPISEVEVTESGTFTGMRIPMEAHLSETLVGAFLRGWKVASDGVLFLLASKTNSKRMSLEECMVR